MSTTPAFDIRDPNFYRVWQDDHVRFGDLDMLGHVNNLAMGSYFENARIALHHRLMPEWPRGPHLFVSVHTEFDYIRELHYPAQIRIGTRLLKMGHSSLHLGGALWQNQNLIATCISISALIDTQTRQSMEIPAELRTTIISCLG